MLDITNNNTASSSDHNRSENGVAKRKRRPAGTPDPEAEVVSLSPQTLLESDRYVCEICGQGFQRDQNLQMHRRRHKVPWKLVKREAGAAAEAAAARKRVFVCPEPSCLHHDPGHALGDLVGIKKHFRRKHSSVKQWACHRCSKAYAVHSDFKAHLKTCGTRGHSCDCGRVFSRVESFIEHQDSCTVRSVQPELQALNNPQPSSSSTSPSSDANLSHNNNSSIIPKNPTLPPRTILNNINDYNINNHRQDFLELQLNPSPSTNLKLSIGSSDTNNNHKNSNEEVAIMSEARREAKRQIEIAEAEFANAKRIRQQAQAELEKAELLREQATKKISSTMLEITCQACKQLFQSSGGISDETTSLAMSYMSSATTEGDGELS